MQVCAAMDSFTPEQVAWLKGRIGTARPVIGQGHDKGTIKWMIGILTAIRLAVFGTVSGVLHTKIGLVCTEVAAVRDGLRAEIGSVRDLSQENRASLAHIETILEERPPRDM